MKRAILMSIQPQWLEKILNREKVIEIRKTMPKCELPIDVYLYCTNTPKYHHLYDLTYVNKGDTLYAVTQHNKYSLVPKGFLNGKVVAKFTLNTLKEVYCERLNNGVGYDYYYELECGTSIAEEANISEDELYNYLGYKDRPEKVGYAWYIDNLEIFDKPKELSYFHKPCICPKMQYCPSCPKGYVYMSEDEEEYYRATNGQEGCETEWVCLNVVEKAPQSWRYVEVKE